jgi:hypothetical protein
LWRGGWYSAFFGKRNPKKVEKGKKIQHRLKEVSSVTLEGTATGWQGSWGDSGRPCVSFTLELF